MKKLLFLIMFLCVLAGPCVISSEFRSNSDCYDITITCNGNVVFQDSVSAHIWMWNKRANQLKVISCWEMEWKDWIYEDQTADCELDRE